MVGSADLIIYPVCHDRLCYTCTAPGFLDTSLSCGEPDMNRPVPGGGGQPAAEALERQIGNRGKNPGEIYFIWGIPKSEGFVIRCGYGWAAPRY